MTQDLPSHGLQLHSKVTRDGTLEISLVEVPLPQPRPDQVLIRVEAAPINPSDLMLLLGPADPATARPTGTPDRPALTAPLPPEAMPGLAGRLDQALTVGNEGAGVVAAAGENVRRLLGKKVAVAMGGMFAQYRVVKAADCLVLPDDVTVAEGASSIVNPLTALGMVGTMRLEGHKALAHTAAASNLGQMLVKICQQDSVGLVNVVRKPQQAALLRDLGARHVCDSSAPSFSEDLTRALIATGATLAFDAIGGGDIASQILSGMEAAASAQSPRYARYGAQSHKQVYVYGSLDPGPTVVTRSFGWAWVLAGWILPPFLERIGPDAADALRARVVAGLRSTFASHYTAEISLIEALQPETMAAYARLATSEKFLLRPHMADG